MFSDFDGVSKRLLMMMMKMLILILNVMGLLASLCWIH